MSTHPGSVDRLGPADAGTWAADRCPPPPLVRAGELCLPAGSVADGTRPVVADVLVVAAEVRPAHRAAALALLLPQAYGVLVRASAVWVWTGDASVRPSRVDLACPPGPPGVPGPRPAPGQATLAVRRTRWSAGTAWCRVGGVALTTPAATAAECARRLPEALARRCVDALLREAGLDLAEVTTLLRARARSPAPPGTADALRLVAALGG